MKRRNLVEKIFLKEEEGDSLIIGGEKKKSLQKEKKNTEEGLERERGSWWTTMKELPSGSSKN